MPGKGTRPWGALHGGSSQVFTRHIKQVPVPTKAFKLPKFIFGVEWVVQITPRGGITRAGVSSVIHVP